MGIIHLMIWITGVAVYMGFSKALTEGTPLSLQGASPLLWGLQSIAAGTSVAGLTLFLFWRAQGWRFPAYAGEYLLATFGLFYVCSLLMPLAYWLIVATSGELPGSPWDSVWMRLYCALLYSASGVLLIVGAMLSRPARWRFILIYFGALLLANAMSVMAHGLQWFTILHAASVIFTLSLLVVCVMDLVQRVRYPWTHWLGPAVCLWSGVIQIVVLVRMTIVRA